MFALKDFNNHKFHGFTVCVDLRTFARKFFNIDFFLKIFSLKDDELVMSEM